MEDKTRKIREGDIRAVSRLIRNLEDRIPTTDEAIRHLFPFTGKAHIIGITGSPGAGKSTLTDELIYAFRQMGKTVGVMAVDPTSPFSGGAILGDRIRMQRHAEDPGVFVRSLATRGALGGLSKAVGEGIHVLDAMGKDIIIVETVGTGQQEVEIIDHAHTVIVVLVPGMGDEIQAIKAGILEIADIFVINKADREGAGKLFKEIRGSLDMAKNFPGGWRPPILMVESLFETHSFSQSVAELAQKTLDHHQLLIDKDLMGDRKRRKATAEMNEAIRAAVLEPVLDELVSSGRLDEMIQKLVDRASDPYTMAAEVAKQYLAPKKTEEP